MASIMAFVATKPTCQLFIWYDRPLVDFGDSILMKDAINHRTMAQRKENTQVDRWIVIGNISFKVYSKDYMHVRTTCKRTPGSICAKWVVARRAKAFLFRLQHVLCVLSTNFVIISTSLFCRSNATL